MYVRIVDMKLDEAKEHLVVIYREVDVDGVDACYESLESGEVENHPKKPGQGNRATAHLVISLKGEPARSGMSYRGALEVVSIYVFFAWNMVTVTLMGLHYLIDRAQRADPTIKPDSDDTSQGKPE